MRSHVTMFTIIVAFALSGGLAAFLLASPDEGRRPSTTELGFGALSSESIDQRIANAEAHHRAAHHTMLARRGATRNARAWLLTIAGSHAAGATLPTSVQLTVDATTRRRTMAFVRWADDLPREGWTVTTTGATVADEQTDVDQPRAPNRYEVRGTIDLAVAQASTRTRRQRLAVTITLDGAKPNANGLPTRWMVRDVATTGQSTFLRGYVDPIRISRGGVDVVAPAGSKAIATRLGLEASTRLPLLVARYRRLAGHGVATIWVLEEGDRSRAVLGRRMPTTTMTAEAGDADGAVWTTPDGDIVADASRLAKLAPSAQLGALRHALAHVATRGLVGDAPALFTEGIPMFEQRRVEHPRDMLAGDDLEPLVTAFGSASSGVAELLVTGARTPLDTGSASIEPLAAVATIAWLEEVHGHETLVRLVGQLDDGVAPARALRNVLRLDARGVEVAVARWTREQAEPADPVVSPDVDSEDAT